MLQRVGVLTPLGHGETFVLNQGLQRGAGSPFEMGRYHIDQAGGRQVAIETAVLIGHGEEIHATRLEQPGYLQQMPDQIWLVFQAMVRHNGVVALLNLAVATLAKHVADGRNRIRIAIRIEPGALHHLLPTELIGVVDLQAGPAQALKRGIIKGADLQQLVSSSQASQQLVPVLHRSRIAAAATSLLAPVLPQLRATQTIQIGITPAIAGRMKFRR